MTKTITFKLNGQEIQCEEGKTILEVARQHGYEIPTLCHSDNLKPFTSCFICVVENHSGRGGFVPSCSTKVADGLDIWLETDEIKATRKMCLDLLLSDHCGDCLPPCESACPSHIDIKGFLKLITEKKYKQAAALIREKAPFPAMLGRVCPAPCETECRRNRVEEAISICAQKRFIEEREAALGGPFLPEPKSSTGKKIAIIGAGPAGMSCAYYLHLAGHNVTVFEKNPQSGGMVRYGIPYYRLPDKVIKREFDAIENLGIKMKYNTEIGKDIEPAILKKDFDAIFLAIGAQAGSSMRVEGEDCTGVLSGIDFLARTAKGEKVEIGQSVIVVGGGNTAMDVARTARRLGAKVTVMYRRTRKEMPAYDFEITEAEDEGIIFEYLTAPVSIKQVDKAVSTKCVRMELGEPDASGRRRPVPKENSNYSISCSTVIAAIGQKVQAEFATTLGIELTKWGTIISDTHTMATNMEGVFAGGDCVNNGPDLAVSAVAAGRKAAYSINQYLNDETVTGEPVLFNSKMGSLDEVSEDLFRDIEKKERIKMPERPASERVNHFQEVALGFEEKAAIEEAKRCLECGCDEVNDCKLRKYAGEYDAEQDRFAGAMRKYENDISHPDAKMEFGKCIMCGACVRACAEIKGLDALGFVGRGFSAQVRPPFGESLVQTACDGCGECFKVCPTAGIKEKKDTV